MTTIFVLLTTYLKHIYRNMNTGNEHFLNHCKLRQMARSVRMPKVKLVFRRIEEWLIGSFLRILGATTLACCHGSSSYQTNIACNANIPRAFLPPAHCGIRVGSHDRPHLEHGHTDRLPKQVAFR